MNRIILIFISLSLSLLAGCSLIADLVEENPPAITAFEASPKTGEAPLDVVFNWKATDLDGDELACTLEFGDKKKVEIANCAEITHQFHTYENPGGYVVKLAASDGRDSHTKSFAVLVKPAPEPPEEE